MSSRAVMVRRSISSAADDHGWSRDHNGSVLRVAGNGIAGVDQILYVKLGGFADVRQRLFRRVSPGVAPLQGRTERVVRRGAVFKTVFLDDDAEHVGLHGPIIILFALLPFVEAAGGRK